MTTIDTLTTEAVLSALGWTYAQLEAAGALGFPRPAQRVRADVFGGDPRITWHRTRDEILDWQRRLAKLPLDRLPVRLPDDCPSVVDQTTLLAALGWSPRDLAAAAALRFPRQVPRWMTLDDGTEVRRPHYYRHEVESWLDAARRVRGGR